MGARLGPALGATLALVGAADEGSVLGEAVGFAFEFETGG